MRNCFECIICERQALLVSYLGFFCFSCDHDGTSPSDEAWRDDGEELIAEFVAAARAHIASLKEKEV